ncbi:MAG: hypothetical protein ACTSVY_16275 [Candidatus Helarchaeota archaeon]
MDEGENLDNLEKIKKSLLEIKSLLHKDEVIWPYQKLTIKEFTKKFFPQSLEKDAHKYFKLKPEKFMMAIENQLKAIDAFLRPLESRFNALDFQSKLFNFFSIYSPKKLNQCQKILKKTPRAIREDFFSDKTLKMASKLGFNQKQVAELMSTWLNMRYYGAMSMGLSPRFLSPFLNTPKSLEEKKESIKKAMEKVRPEIEKKWNEYDQAIFVKEKLDEERKLMTFGPESIKKIISSLEMTYFYSVTGKISKKESLEITHLAQEIVNDALIIGKKEKKTFVNEEKRKEIANLIEKINSKPELFFTIAQTTNFIRKGKRLNEIQEKTLQKIIKLGDLLPDNTEEALKHDQIKKSFGIIFEPLENLLHVEDLEHKEKKKKKKTKKEELTGLELLKDAIEGIAKWILKRIIEEKKQGLENILKLFNGIPPILGSNIVKIIFSKKMKVNKEQLKEYFIEYLSHDGIYEIYSELSAGEAEKTKEIEVASEIIIPPQPDQRLAPILKQIKFEFMKFLETKTIKKQPIFDKLEAHKIIPNNVVETLLETTQDMLIDIINKNAENKLHEIIKVDKKEYEVKLKTISLKLKLLMKRFDESLINIIEKLEVYKLNENTLLSEFKGKIQEIWINSLITKKKIEQQDISTSSVSAIAAKLMGRKPAEFKGPPKGTPAKLPAKLPPSKVPAKLPSKLPPSKVPAKLPSKLPPSKVPAKLPAKLPPSKVPAKTMTEVSQNSSFPHFQNIKSIASPELTDVMIDTIKAFPSLLQDTTRPERQIVEINEKEKEKIVMIKKTIAEVEELLESYTEEPDKFSPEELKHAFKLLAKVHKLNLEKVEPKEIREVITLAEELKMKRDIIAAQMEHIKSLDIEKKLGEASLKVLESKLELIVKYYDEYIEEIYKFLDYLGQKTSSYLKQYQKKAGQAYWKSARIKKASMMLKENIQLLLKVSKLSDELIIKAQDYFTKLQEYRKKRKNNRLIGQAAQKFGDLINMDKKKVLKLTRESDELIIALEEIFKVRVTG